MSEHNDIVIRHKGEKLKAYSEEIGSRICIINYYHREMELEKLEKSILQYGMLDPIKIWQEPNTGEWIIIDGHNRYSILKSIILIGITGRIIKL